MPHSARRVKIVCTLGPATESPGMVRALVRAGMDVARLNCSHGDHAWHARMIRTVRLASSAEGKPVAILADLQGPKIRTGATRDGHPVPLSTGREVVLTTRPVVGDGSIAHVDDPAFAQKVSRGSRVLLDDGLLELRVLAAGEHDVRCLIVHGGPLGAHKGVNLPGVRWRRPALTPKDRADLAFALAADADWIALSFVQSARDVRSVKAAIRRAGSAAPLIVKLEKPEAVADLEAVLDAADGVMIARGDLGVELGPEKVPVLQKRIIQRAHVRHLPVITATQMLESMTASPRPTRAEASDVANAVFDDTDAVMLSGETASGAFPLETVAMMDRIVREAEAHHHGHARHDHGGARGIPETIAEAVRSASADLHIKAIAAFTERGRTVQLVSSFRPPAPLYGFSSRPATVRRMSLCWGVRPRAIPRVRHVEQLSRHAEAMLRREGVLKPGDVLAIVAGTPLRRPGRTNFLKLLVVGEPH